MAMGLRTGMALCVAASVLLAGCAPVNIVAGAAATAATAAATAAATPAAASPLPTPDALATAIAEGRATATVSIPALRVRAAPTENSRQIGSVKEGQSYIVTGRSDNGGWFRLAVPVLAAGEGWVSTNFVTVLGDITDIPVIAAPTPLPPTATPTRFLPTPTTEAGATAAATEATTEPAAGPAFPTATPTEATGPAAAGPTATLPMATSTPAPPPAAGFARVVTDGARLRVRAAPDAGAAIVGYAYNGEVYAVLEDSADGAWTRIAGSAAGAGENPDGGWVATRFLLLGQ